MPKKKMTRPYLPSGNYVCDEESYPQQVQFSNGRIVQIRYTADGRPYLDIRWATKSPEDTFIDNIMSMSDTEIWLASIWEYGSPAAAEKAVDRIRDIIKKASKGIELGTERRGLITEHILKKLKN